MATATGNEPHLSDGSTVDTNVAVIALGSLRNTEWLRGSGLAAALLGVACDLGGRAFDVNGMVTDDVFVGRRCGAVPPPAVRIRFPGAGALGAMPWSGRRSRPTT